MYNRVPDLELDAFIRQVKRNCDISDAAHWGGYSICGLLLRLREMYRFENGLRHWDDIDSSEIADWIGRRETFWEELSDSEYGQLTIDGKQYDPFDVSAVNSALGGRSLVYGAGIGLFMKPSFFVAELLRRERIDGFDIHVSGKVLARDLSMHPAMLQGTSIFARTDAAYAFLWDRYDDFRAHRREGALAQAFRHYGIGDVEYPPEELDSLIRNAAVSETENYIRHELGEGAEGGRLGPGWDELLLRTCGRRASMFVRSVKDVLADTCPEGMLNFIISSRNPGSLAFYVASLGSYRKALSKDVEMVYRDFVTHEDWDALDAARIKCYESASSIAAQLLKLHRENAGDADLSGVIESGYMAGL